MSSAPSYYFNGISFNNDFYNESSSSLSSSSLATLNALYINKIGGSDTTGTKTFSNPTLLESTLSIKPDVLGVSSVNFYDSTNTLKSQIENDGTAQSINSLTLANGLNILKNSSIVATLHSTVMRFNSLSMTYSDLPTLTPYHIGFNYGSNTQSYTGNKLTIGRHLAYSSQNAVALPIGTYLIAINAALGFVANPITGTCNPFIVGYTLGPSSNPASNTGRAVFVSPNAYEAQGYNANYQFNVTALVKITADNRYLCAYTSNDITAVFSTGSAACQSGVASYYVIRVG